MIAGQALLQLVREDGCGQGGAGVIGAAGVNIVCCDLAARFWPKVAVTETCWVWLGAVDRGYPRFAVPTPTNAHGLATRAYRWAYEHYIGAIPAGLDLDHVCRERACVRWDDEHLEVVTRRTNIRRAITTNPQRLPFDPAQQEALRERLRQQDSSVGSDPHLTAALPPTSSSGSATDSKECGMASGIDSMTSERAERGVRMDPTEGTLARDQIGSLESIHEGLSKELYALAERLEYALRPGWDSRPTGDDGGARVSDSSAIVTQLRHACEVASDLTDRVRRMRNGLEV